MAMFFSPAWRWLTLSEKLVTLVYCKEARMKGCWKRHLPAVLFFLTLLCSMPCALEAVIGKSTDGSPLEPQDVLQSQANGAASYKEGEVLIKFKHRMTAAEAGMLADALAAAVVKEFPIFSRQRQGVYFMITSSQRSTQQLLDDLRARPDVEAVSPNYRRRLQRLPNDPKFNRLWGMNKIGAPAAWEKNIGSSGVVLAVMDTGVDYRQEDLAANMWENPGEIAANGIDDDGNGFIDDIHGYDFAADDKGGQDSDPMDIDTHGTHVAGTMAGVGNNGTGVCGINWNVKVMALKCFRPDIYIYDSDTIEALEYAVLMKRDFGVNIVAINASFGGGGADPLLKDAIADAGDQGIALVCAAGNNGADNDATPFYPASYDLPNVVVVAATDEDDLLASFSNFGTNSVDIAAPGVGILSTVPAGKGLEASLTSGADVYNVIPLAFSGFTPATGLTGLLVDCGKGLNGSYFPAEVSGNIALIERGDITFREKVINAQNAGAAAAVIFNNEAGNFSGTLSEAGNWIPVIALAREDGLLEKVLGLHQVTVVVAAGNYEFMDGTSMAAPHVCGAMGLLAAQYPADSLTKRIARIYAGADHLDALAGKMKTSARLNLTRSLTQNLLLTLAVFRRQTNVWVVKKDYAQVYFSVDSDPGSPINASTYGIYRSRAGDAFQLLKDVAAGELQNHAYTFYDKYLDRGTIYSYVVKAKNAQGVVIAVSNGQSI
jgi:subtilisin family serine protease